MRLHSRVKDPVVPISANLRLNFIPGFFFFYWKAFFRVLFFVLFELSNLNSEFALTLGYLTPALSNPVQFVSPVLSFSLEILCACQI